MQDHILAEAVDSDERETGGPAFPPVHNPKTHDSGMTLRDWFAGQALAEVLRLTEHHEGGWDAVAVASGAYHLADAMLAARGNT